MHQQEKISEQKLREASTLIARHLGMEVIEAAIHGSVLRGFNDPNSDTDICFLLNRPVSDYLGMTTSPFFDCGIEERRKATLKLSQTLSKELGWSIMVSVLDMRSILRGILSASPFALMAYESFAKKNQRVRDLFGEIAADYFILENLVYRCGDQIQHGIVKYLAIDPHGAEFKQERAYLGTLWSAHRLLAYLGGDKQHCRTITELIENNRSRWERDFSEGFQSSVIGVLKARTERSHFDMPKGVNDIATQLLKSFVDKVLREATLYLRKHPHRQPSATVETRELVDLYGALLDIEDEKYVSERRVYQEKNLLAA